MRGLGVLMAVLALLACNVEQSEPAGQSKKMVAIEEGSGGAKMTETESCSKFFRQLPLSPDEQQFHEEDIKKHGLPVPEKFDTYFAADDNTAENIDPLNSNADPRVKVVSVSKKAKELFWECIECRQIVIGDEDNYLAKLALKLKNGSNNLMSDNIYDRIIVYGEGENPRLNSDNNELITNPMICAYSGSQKNCVSIDVENCKEEAIIDYQ